MVQHFVKEKFCRKPKPLGDKAAARAAERGTERDIEAEREKDLLAMRPANSTLGV
jgi:hypothetical protein